MVKYLISFLIVSIGLLKVLEIYETNRVKDICFSIKKEMPIETALKRLSNHQFIEIEQWEDERVKSLGLYNSYSVAVSLLTNRTISCFIEHDNQRVIDVSTGSHFWSWLYE